MLYVFLYISELLISVKILLSESYIRRARRVSHQFKAECRRDNISSLRSVFIYGESKFFLHAGSPSCLRSTFCAATPRLIIQNPCVMCKVFYWFSVCCSRVRVTTRWWTLMVAAHLLPLYLGESVFPGGFRWCPLRSFPVLSFLKVCHLGAWWFRGFPRGSPSLPVVPWVPFSL